MSDDGADGVVRPPFLLFGAAAAAALGGLALLPMMQLTMHVLGYLLSSVLCFLLTAGFLQLDSRRASRGLDYRPWEASRRACMAVLVAGFTVACWHSWYIATELAVA